MSVAAAAHNIVWRHNNGTEIVSLSADGTMDRRVATGRDVKNPNPESPPCGVDIEHQRTLTMGTFWLFRIRLRSPFYVKKLPGCGCVRPVKNFVRRILRRKHA